VQATKQQQIMGFFIEEAKEHLDTIEQGLLDLQTTMADPEQLNEMFRAAHSVKGGAAMLGFNSIQRVGHYLEDNFKILKDKPIRPDRQLEDLFLKVLDTLKELVEALQSPYGFQEKQGEQIVEAAQPNFLALQTYLNRLLQGGETMPPAVKVSPESAALVNAVLRKMLELFKQPDTSMGRQQLAALCGRMGQVSDSPEWHHLLRVAQQAIASSRNSYQLLAPLVIKELKLASDLLIAKRFNEILPSQNLARIANLSSAAPSPERSLPASPPSPTSRSSVGAESINLATRTPTIPVPLEPRAAARALLENFSKTQLIELAEFLMKAIQ
jgi:chemotaxis protein histidine kinase CheA